MLACCLADQLSFGNYVRKWTECQQQIWDIQRWRWQNKEDIAALCLRTWIFTGHPNTCEEMSCASNYADWGSWEKRAMFAVELAILAGNDEVAAYLIRIMWHERYRN